jgi:hypothetical protein
MRSCGYAELGGETPHPPSEIVVMLIERRAIVRLTAAFKACAD